MAILSSDNLGIYLWNSLVLRPETKTQKDYTTDVNRSNTVLDLYIPATEQYGLPSHVCSNKGGENVKICEYTLRRRTLAGIATLLESPLTTNELSAFGETYSVV